MSTPPSIPSVVCIAGPPPSHPRTTASVMFSAGTDGLPGVWAMGRNEEGQLLNCSFSSADMPHRCEILLRVVSESRPSAARRDEMDDASEGPDVNLESNGQNKEGCVADIACGQYFTVVLMSHGEVLVGGDNSCGQLGLGTMVLGPPTKGTVEPTQVHGVNSGCAQPSNLPVPVPDMRGKIVTRVACGAYHTLLGVEEEGMQVYAFGCNSDGQLGLGNGQLGWGLGCRHQTTPCLISALLGQNLAHISCGAASSFAVTNEGGIFGWGDNQFGQLALGHSKPVFVPNKTPWLAKGQSCIQIECGAVHSLLLCKSGKVYTCGKNEAGLLGTGLRGGPPFWSTPQLVEPLLSKHVRMVACGVRHSAAVGYDAQRKQTRLFTWGSNSHGQLGLSGVPLDAWVLRSKVVDAIEHDVVDVSCGSFHTVALSSAGKAYSWGDNRHRQLGIDSTVSHEIGGEHVKVSKPLMAPNNISFRREPGLPSEIPSDISPVSEPSSGIGSLSTCSSLPTRGFQSEGHVATLPPQDAEPPSNPSRPRSVAFQEPLESHPTDEGKGVEGKTPAQGVNQGVGVARTATSGCVVAGEGTGESMGSHLEDAHIGWQVGFADGDQGTDGPRLRVWAGAFHSFVGHSHPLRPPA